jgi:hypothetical protein
VRKFEGRFGGNQRVMPRHLVLLPSGEGVSEPFNGGRRLIGSMTRCQAVGLSVFA